MGVGTPLDVADDGVGAPEVAGGVEPKLTAIGAEEERSGVHLDRRARRQHLRWNLDVLGTVAGPVSLEVVRLAAVVAQLHHARLEVDGGDHQRMTGRGGLLRRSGGSSRRNRRRGRSDGWS